MSQPVEYVVDLETVSSVNIKNVTTLQYAQHNNTHITMAGVALADGGTVKVVIHPKLWGGKASDSTLEFFKEFLIHPDKIIIAHNTQFEQRVLDANIEGLARSLGLRESWVPPKRYICTADLSRAARGPDSLENACNYFKILKRKDIEGAALTKQICTTADTPQENLKTKEEYKWEPTLFYGRWAIAGEELYKRQADYCATDVKACRALYREFRYGRYKQLIGTWELAAGGSSMTNDMNSLGIKFDRGYVDKLHKYSDLLAEEGKKFCMDNFGARSPGCTVAIRENLRSRGYEIDSLRQDNLENTLLNENNQKLPELGELLKQYTKLNKSGLKKAAKFKEVADGDIIKDAFKFGGARKTGRWSSQGAQLQNMPRGNDAYSIEMIEDFMKDPYTDIIGNTDKALTAIRQSLVPRPGYKFFVVDLAQIELRMALYRAGHFDELQCLVDGKDLYKLTATDVYNVSESEITKDQRGIGKVLVLSCGYGQGADSFRKKVLSNTGKVITPEEASEAVDAYQSRFCGIPEYWNKLGKEAYMCARSNKPLALKLETDRTLFYPGMRYHTFKNVDDEGNVTYKREIIYRTDKGIATTWGGKLFNNKIQGESRDIILAKMVDLWEKDVRIIATIHDEIIAEVPVDDPLEKWEELWRKAGKKYIDKWMPDLPLGSDASFMRRYTKG